jgi:hypothetical protein
MRTYHVVAVLAVVLVGAGVKLTQLTSVQAQHVEAGQGRSGSSEENRYPVNLPVQEFEDMSFIFSLTADGRGPTAADEPSQGSFTRRCAERDLRAFTAIEEFGRIKEMPTAWLADAGLTYVQARGYCLAGAEREGVGLYDRIIAGDARLPNALTMNERGTR